MLDQSMLLALTAVMIYGSTQVLAKVTVRSLSAVSMVAINFVVSVPIYLVFLIATLTVVDRSVLRFEYILYAIIGAATARGGYYIYLEALEKGAVSMVGSITAAFPAITAMLAVLLLGESVTPINGLGIALIIASMVALSFMHGDSYKGSGFSSAALVLSVVVLVIWGVGGVFIKLALSNIPLVAYLGVYPFILPPIAFAYLRHKQASKDAFFPKWTVPVVFAIMVVELWQLAYFAETGAVSKGAASIVYPVVSAYPIITIAGARLVLKEHMSRIEWALILAVVLGILLTSVV
ncbi:MAG: DMT family transporter [Thermoplasmata archaeon]